MKNRGNDFLRQLQRISSFKLIRGRNHQHSYINARDTIRAARSKNISVCEYLEELWDQKGDTAFVINEMKAHSCFKPNTYVCEIGPGSGRYLESVIRQIAPLGYDIYEIADDWAEWLATTYGPTVRRQEADGQSLKHTPDGSCHLIHAHGVFVYLSLLNSFHYFHEMIRVCASGGYIVFDFFAENAFTLPVIANWLKFPERYPVILNEKKIIDFFSENGFTLIHQFSKKYGHSQSTYVIFKNQG